MNTQEIANRLAALCRTGDYETAQREFFADDAVSIEPNASDKFAKETKGLEAIYEKGRVYESTVEHTYGITVTDPVVAANSFAFVLTLDVKMKGHDRFTGSELCVYKLKDGKIISEEFFM